MSPKSTATPENALSNEEIDERLETRASRGSPPIARTA